MVILINLYISPLYYEIGKIQMGESIKAPHKEHHASSLHSLLESISQESLKRNRLFHPKNRKSHQNHSKYFIKKAKEHICNSQKS